LYFARFEEDLGNKLKPAIIMDTKQFFELRKEWKN
jgi:hypothetical protein